MTEFIISLLHSFAVLSLCILMWTSIIRDLAQIRAAQKIECESIARLAKLLDEERKDEQIQVTLKPTTFDKTLF